MDQCLLCPICCPWMQSLSSPGPQAHIITSFPQAWEYTLAGSGNLMEAPWRLSPVFFPSSCHLWAPVRGVHWLTGHLQGIDCPCECSAQGAPLIPYQHAFDSVGLVPFFFSRLHLYCAPVSWFCSFILSLPGSSLWCSSSRAVCLQREHVTMVAFYDLPDL